MPIPISQSPHPHPHPPHPSHHQLTSYSPAQLHSHLIASPHIATSDAQLLLSEDVDGQSALALTHDNLKALGVTTFGRRQRLLDALAGGRAGKAGEGAGEDRVVSGKVEGYERAEERRVEHERREGGLLSHFHLPRPHTATQPPHAHDRSHPAPSHEPQTRPHSAQPAHPHHPPPATSHASHNVALHTTADGKLVYPPEFVHPHYSGTSPYNPIPSLPITPYQPPLAYAPNLPYPPSYALHPTTPAPSHQPHQPYQPENKSSPHPGSGRQQDGGWDDQAGSDSDAGDGFIRGEPVRAEPVRGEMRRGGAGLWVVGRAGVVESVEEMRRRQRQVRAEAELRWEEDKEERRKEKDEVMRLKLELQRREDERERIRAKPATRKHRNKEAEDEDEEAERLTPSPTRPFPARPTSAGARTTPAPPPLLSPPPLTPPAHTLSLTHVHGYTCAPSQAARHNLHLTAAHGLVYPAGRLCVVQGRDGRQQFFEGHDGPVRSLAQHPTNRNLFASSSAGAPAVAAGSGPAGSGGLDAPVLLVWDAGNVHAKGLGMPLTVADGSVRSVSFSVDGLHLASVSSDAHYTLKLFHWPTATLLASVHTAATSTTSPPQPTQLCLWNPLHAGHLLTLGKRHLVFWQWRDGKLRGQRAVASDEEQSGTTLVEYESAAYSAKGFACVATSTGQVLVYTDAHSAPRSFAIASPTSRVVALLAHKAGLAAALDDGQVLLLSRAMETQKRLRFRARAIALAWCGDGELAVGTRDGKVWRAADVWERTVAGEDGEGGQLVVQSHWEGAVRAVADVDERRYATVGEDGTVLLWDADKRRVEKRAQLGNDRAALASGKDAHSGHKALCVAVGEEDGQKRTKGEPTSAAKLLVVGMEDGSLHVLSTSLRQLYRVNVEQCIAHSKRAVHTSATSGSAITCLSFCPRGHALAVGTGGGLVAVFSLSHTAATLLDVDALPSTSSGAVTHLDWSASAAHLLVSTPLSASHYYNFSPSTRTLAPVPHSLALSMHSHLFPTLTSPLSFPLAPLLPAPLPAATSQPAVAAHPTAGGGLVVSAGAGLVRLYRWSGRCVRRQGWREVRGHAGGSGAVVGWLGESGVVSAGSDMVVMQWKLV